MKVLDLKCAQQHVFEGWFASEDDFQSQQARGLVSCPVCGDASVDKQLSAPRLNLGAGEPAASVAPRTPAGPVMRADPQVQAAFLKAMRDAVARTEDVGERFAEVARQMHYGEIEERGIRGRTSAQEAVELLEEGISVLPLPPVLKEPLQ